MVNRRIIKSQSNTDKQLVQQSFFVILIFVIMVSLSYFFVSMIIRNNLVKNSKNTMNSVSQQLSTDLMVPQVILTGVSQTVRTMVLHNDSVDRIHRYMGVIRNSITGFELYDMNNYGFFCYINSLNGESAFIESLIWEKPEGYEPTERRWYKNAVAAEGKIAKTMDYSDVISGKIIIVYSVCIYDDNGKQLGVVAIRVGIETIGQKIVETSLAQGGYGMLISDDLIMLAHINPDFIGKYVPDAKEIPISIFSDLFKDGRDVLERHIINFKGNASVAFFIKQPGNWYLGFVVPQEPYYHSLRTMAWVLFIFGAVSCFVLIVILFRLDKARNKSDKENKYKSMFLANMSHELRTPLSAITGMTTIGMSADNLEKKNYCFTKIETASKHLLGIISNVLDMSKIQENKFEIFNSEFYFERMLQRVTDFTGFKIDEKQQEFTVEIDPNIPPMLIGDEQRLAQVITNLLSNAVKFTPEGGSIGIATKLLGEENGICEIKIDIKDSGIGISKKEQELLFQPFQQADVNTTRKFGGTGLGLSICKSIVELMGGRIWVESEYGKGSTFSFTFEMKRGEETNMPFVADINKAHLSDLKIMVVDDNNDILLYFEEVLKKFGMNCDTAQSGKEALATVQKKGNYNVYFVDWRMPEINGIELTEKLKNGGYAGTNNSIVIMISAGDLTNVETTARIAGVDKFLSKPLFPSAIIEILTEFLGIENHKMQLKQIKSEDNFENYHILIVEDVKVNVEILFALFEPTKLKIDCAENGFEAVEMFAENPDKYDLILMDLQMPEMDGYQATKKIRAMNSAKAKEIPIIAMTANVFKEDIEQCLKSGMNDHIGKPIDFELVLEKMRKYLPKK